MLKKTIVTTLLTVTPVVALGDFKSKDKPPVTVGLTVVQQSQLEIEINNSSQAIENQAYDKAESTLLRTIETIEKINPTQEELKAKALLNLGIIYIRTNRTNTALSVLNQAISIIKPLYKEHKIIAEGHYLISTIFLSKEDYENTLKHINEAYLITSKLPTERVLKFKILNQTAIYHIHKRNLAAAIQSLEEAIQIGESLKDTATIGLSGTWHMIGNCYRENQQPAESIQAFDRAILLYQAEYGSDYPEIATVLLDKALTLLNQGQNNEAEALLLKSYDLWERTLGIEHPYSARTQATLGQLAFNKQDYLLSMKYFKQVLAIQRNQPAAHLELANALIMLGQITQILEPENTSTAEAYFNEGLNNLITYAPENPSIGITQTKLGGILLQTNRPEEAQEMINSGINNIKSAFGPKSPYLVEAYYLLGLLYHSLGNATESEKYYKMSAQLIP